MLGGIQVNEPDHDVWMQSLKDAGLNTVSVTVYAKQGDWDTPNLWFDIEDEYVVREIQTAKKHGLRVVLILRVALDHAYERNHFLWHGMIAPQGDSAVHHWFNSYSAFVAQWADIAEETGVDVLAIGSEMNALTATTPVQDIPPLEEWYLNEEKQATYKARTLTFSNQLQEKHLWVRGTDNYQELDAYLQAKAGKFRTWAQAMTFKGDSNALDRINARRAELNAQWLSLIGSTRARYSGQLTYAANFDNYQEVGFWNALDFVGINAYFALREWPVTPNAAAATEEMTASWNRIFADINSYRLENQLTQPVLFTELGYTWRKYSTVEPWGGFGFSVLGPDSNPELMVWQEQPTDYLERTWAVEALHTASKANPGVLAGILYWKLTTNPAHEAIEPFALVLGKPEQDPMQAALARFGKEGS